LNANGISVRKNVTDLSHIYGTILQFLYDTNNKK
jgi:hypothetical protein